MDTRRNSWKWTKIGTNMKKHFEIRSILILRGRGSKWLTGQEITFHFSQNHAMVTTSQMSQILAEDASFHMKYCLLIWDENWSIQRPLSLSGSFWPHPGLLFWPKRRHWLGLTSFFIHMQFHKIFLLYVIPQWFLIISWKPSQLCSWILRYNSIKDIIPLWLVSQGGLATSRRWLLILGGTCWCQVF